MIDIYTAIVLLILHFIADFILQTDKMAINKSSSNYWLTLHVTTYSIPFILIHPLYALINGVLHWVTDWTTSRTASYFYKKDNRSMFFKTIGLDQLIHGVTLIGTYYLMVDYYEYIIPWIL